MRPTRKIRRILVAIKDPRARSLPAVAKAAQIARACNARLELFHDLSDAVFVEALDTPSALQAVTREASRAALAGLARLAAPLRAAGLTVRTAVEWDYPPHESIIRHALRARADLIITPSRAHHLASALGRAFDVVYAYRPQPLAPRGTALSVSRAARTIETRVRAAARAALDRELRYTKVSAARRHLIEAHPVDAITGTARRLGTAIVVMGAISRRGLKRFFIGNSAEQLLDELRCDLLVVKPARFVTAVPRSRRGVHLTSAIGSL